MKIIKESPDITFSREDSNNDEKNHNEHKTENGNEQEQILIDVTMIMMILHNIKLVASVDDKEPLT